MSKHKNGHPSPLALAKSAAIEDMRQNGETVVPALESAPVTSATVNPEPVATVNPEPVATVNPEPVAKNIATNDEKATFIASAVALIGTGSAGVPVNMVFAEMSKRGFTFPVATEKDKTPRSKNFSECKTEKTANRFWGFLVNELRSKSTVQLDNGRFLYYSESKVFASTPLPADSVNAWKEALKNRTEAAGK